MVPVHEPAGRERGGEARRRVLRGLGGNGAALRLPLLPAAVEHGRALEAEGAQHPPDAGRPHDAAGRIEHDAGRVADAEPAHRVREALGRRGHEFEARAGVRSRSLEVQEHRARNMRLVIFGPARHNTVGGVVAGFRGPEPYGAVHDAQLRRAQHRFQFAGFDKRPGIAPLRKVGPCFGHRRSPLSFGDGPRHASIPRSAAPIYASRRRL